MLTHYRTRRRIGAYLDGALDQDWARTAATHLESCVACQREADELRRLKALVVRAVPAGTPEWTGFWEGVVRGIQDGRVVKPVEIGWRWPWAVWGPQLAFGGAVATALVASFTLWQVFATPIVRDDGVVVKAARTEVPDATVMVYSPPERDLAVVWVFDRD